MDTTTDQRLNQPGMFRRISIYFFGERAERLHERGGQSHWLSYLLVFVQSAAVVLALGHQTIGLLFNSNLFIRLIAAMVLFLLVATVWAADLCLLATLKRVPVLARNRQNWMVLEHLTYITFVLCVEGVTLAIVLAVTDTDPLALVSSHQLIFAAGWVFSALICARVILTIWTSVQLWVIRQKLPPQWTTLMQEGLELIGGKVQTSLANLDLDHANVGQLVEAYGAMNRPPNPIERWWNRGLVRRQNAALAQEDQQRQAVVGALKGFERPVAAPRRTSAGGADAPVDFTAARRARHPSGQRPRRAARRTTRRQMDPEHITAAIGAYLEEHGAESSVRKIADALGMSPSTIQKYMPGKASQDSEPLAVAQ